MVCLPQNSHDGVCLRTAFASEQMAFASKKLFLGHWDKCKHLSKALHPHTHTHINLPYTKGKKRRSFFIKGSTVLKCHAFLMGSKVVKCKPTLRASLSGTFLRTLPELLTPLKGHSLSPCSCPPMWSAPSERFGYPSGS